MHDELRTPTRLELVRSAFLPDEATIAAGEARVAAAKARLDEEERADNLRRRTHNLAAAKVRILEEDEWAVLGLTVEGAHYALSELPAFRTVRAWFRSPQRFLVVLGSTGIGKSVAAAWAIAEIGGLYLTADELRRAFAQEHNEARKLRRELFREPFVVVDELFTEGGFPADAKRAVQELVDGRQRLRTILMGNETVDEFAERYGQRVVERVRHQGTLVHIAGDSLRRDRPRHFR